MGDFSSILVISFMAINSSLSDNRVSQVVVSSGVVVLTSKLLVSLGSVGLDTKENYS